jgi:hypothetical protein
VRIIRAFNAAPSSIRAAAGLSALEAMVWAVVGVISARGDLPGHNTAVLVVSLALGVLLFASLFALPAAIVSSRYPLRRYREAIVFQAVLLLVFVDAFTGHPSPVGAVLCVAALAALYLLLRPAARKYVAGREARFTSALRGD